MRGVRVMLDFDLAELYQVETKVLKQTVRRNLDRFPEDFMFELTEQEHNSLIISLRSQIASSKERGGRRHMPFAFTEQGVAMLASVLKSDTAIMVNRSIIRAFVAMRNYIMSTQHLESELAALKVKLELLERNDEENLEAITRRSGLNNDTLDADQSVMHPRCQCSYEQSSDYIAEPVCSVSSMSQLSMLTFRPLVDLLTVTVSLC